MKDYEMVCGGNGEGVLQTADFRRNRYLQGRGLDPALDNSNGLRCSAGYTKLPKWREDAADPAWLQREQL